MKKTIYTVLFAVLAFMSSNVFGQQEVKERKLQSLNHAEKAIFQLGIDADSMKMVIYPEILSNRHNLAPHYPDLSTIERTDEARKAAFFSWIESYPAECDDYTAYLQNIINQYRN